MTSDRGDPWSSDMRVKEVPVGTGVKKAPSSIIRGMRLEAAGQLLFAAVTNDHRHSGLTQCESCRLTSLEARVWPGSPWVGTKA